MSPARAHRERHASGKASTSPTHPVASSDQEGGQDQVDLTPARKYRLEQAAQASVKSVAGGAAEPDRVKSAEEATIGLRLTHDQRRLSEIKAVSKKIEAKREMIPAYRAWIDGIVSADAGVGTGLAAEVLPTIMIWSIDTGDFDQALVLAEFVLRHKVQLPARYKRDAPNLIVEEVAKAALTEQAAGKRFPLDVLEHVALLAVGADIFDEVSAKLAKAIGVELHKASDEAEGEAVRPMQERALATLRDAQTFDPRAGVKGRIAQLEKILNAPATPAG